MKVGIKLQLFFIIQRHSDFTSFSTSERLIFGVAIILAMHGYFPFHIESIQIKIKGHKEHICHFETNENYA